MRTFITLGLAIAVLALLTGCHANKTEGTWKPQGAATGGMNLVITGDKFEMNMMGQSVKGTAALDGKTLTLTPSEVDGKPPTSAEDKKPVTMTLSEDGKTLSGKDGLITLEKQ